MSAFEQSGPVPRGITFDVTGTLIHSPRRAEIYGSVLARHGVEVPSRDALEEVLVQVWQELECLADPRRDRFADHPGGAGGWWRRYVARVGEHLDHRTPIPFAAAELFHEFGRAAAWEIYPEVVPTLEALSRLEVPMAVVSNWDERLPGLLADLGLGRFFEAIVYSQAVGLEKPSPEIFTRALADLAVAPAEGLHVGDSARHDLEGALAAGMEALLLRRRGEGGDLGDLARLPELVRITRRANRPGVGS
ncbi:MAG: HAD-IA family hydrolase [Acidobacteriota bacterium]